MPTRIGGSRRKSYFSAAAASVVDDSGSMSVVSNGIVEVYPKSPEGVLETGTAMATRSEFSSVVEKPPNLEELVLSSTSNTTKNTDIVGGSNCSQAEDYSSKSKEEEKARNSNDEDLSIGVSLNFSPRKPGDEVSWSDSEGSTYVSALDTHRNDSVPLIHSFHEEQDERVVKNESSSSPLPGADTADGILYDVALNERGDGYAADYISSTTEEVSTILDHSDRSRKPPKRTPQKPISKVGAQEENSNVNTENWNSSSAPRKATVAQEATGKGKGRHRENTKRPPVAPPSCRLSYSASVTTQSDPNHLDYVDYYSDVDIASSNDDISEVGFLSKEATSEIFCRRLVPLEIPVKNVEEDNVSAVSTANEPAAMPSVTAGDNSELAVTNVRKSKSEKVVSTGPVNADKENRNCRLKNVDYLPSVRISSKQEDQDISTVAYKLPYNIAHAAFAKVDVPVPMVFPVHNDQDEVSTIHGSVTRRNELMEIFIPRIQCSLSSLDSASFESKHDHNEEMFFGDDGSDNAVRPAKDKRSKQNEGYEKGMIDTQHQKRHTRKADERDSQKQRHKSSNRHRNGERGGDNGRSSDTQPKTKTELKNLSSKPTKKPVKNQHEPRSQLEDESSTDARIRELKEKIRAMQLSSSLTPTDTPDVESRKNSREKQSSSKKAARRREGTKTVTEKHRLAKEGKGHPSNASGNNDSTKVMEGSSQPKSNRRNVAESKRPEHVVIRKDDMHDRLRLYDVDYLDAIDIASNNHDISTVDVRVTEESAKDVFVRSVRTAFENNVIPTEVPVDEMDEVSAIHSISLKDRKPNSGASADLEDGLKRNQEPESSLVSTDDLNETTKRTKPATSTNEQKKRIDDFLIAAKTRTVEIWRITQSFAVNLWKEHMDGRSTNEKIIIVIIGLSFFVLLILLFAAIAKR